LTSFGETFKFIKSFSITIGKDTTILEKARCLEKVM